MTSELRRFSQGGVCLFSLSVLIGGALFTPETLPKFELCWFHRLTDLPCPGCGLTRSVCSIAHGRFADAWEYHPFGYLFFSLFLLGAFTPLLARMAPDLENRLWRSRWTSVGSIGLVIALIVFGGYRLVRMLALS